MTNEKLKPVMQILTDCRFYLTGRSKGFHELQMIDRIKEAEQIIERLKTRADGWQPIEKPNAEQD